MKYAMLKNGVVNTISMETETGAEWIQVPDDVFAGFTKQNDGSFLAPPLPPKHLEPLEPWQFFAALDLSGKRAALDTFMNALPEPNKTIAKAKLNHTKTFHPDNDVVLAAIAGLGLTDTEFKALWAIGENLA